MTDQTQAGALRRQVLRVRRRHAWWMALCGGLGLNALLGLALWASAPRSQPPPSIHVMPAQPTPAPAPIVTPSIVVPPAPLVVVVPAAAPTSSTTAPPAFGDLGPCPAEHTARPAGRLAQPAVDEQVDGFSGAPTDSRWVATWSREHLFVSRDGGASWDRVLDGPGAMIGAGFDCHGRVVALREGAGLGMRDGAREAWRPGPGIHLAREVHEDDPRYIPRLVGGGRQVAVVGSSSDELDHAHAAMTADGGITWSHADLSWYEGAPILAAWEGELLRIAVPWTDCMSEGTRMVTVGASGVREEELADAPAGQLALDRGKVVAVSEDWCSLDRAASPPQLCVWREGRGWRPTPVPGARTGGDDDPSALLVEGPVDVIQLGRTVHVLSGARIGRGRDWDPAWTLLGTDRAGRLWGSDGYAGLVRR